MALSGQVALVTGASRGIGRGIALALAKEGAKVHITGRHRGGKRADGHVGDLDSTAGEVSAAGSSVGGCCVALVCDHSDDLATERVVNGLFEKEGKIDILVNNAFQGLDSTNQFGDITQSKFWEKPLAHFDMFHRVGLRSHYIVLALCARHWVERKQKALCINVSSAAGVGYVFDVAYGIGKCGVDRLTADAALELKPHGITVISLWPGAVATEIVLRELKADSSMTQRGDLFHEMETVEFSGRGVAALAKNPEAAMRWTGRVAMTPELGEEFGFKDLDGSIKWGTFLPSMREAMKRPPRHWVKPSPSKAKL